MRDVTGGRSPSRVNRSNRLICVFLFVYDLDAEYQVVLILNVVGLIWTERERGKYIVSYTIARKTNHLSH